jgi:transcription elongation factor Elf1
MVGIFDDYGTEREEPVIDNQIDCPRCGFQGCTITRMPQPETWMNRIGKARCDHCGATFDIQAIDDE